MGKRVNTLYPNCPADFPGACAAARRKQGITMVKMANDLGQKHPAYINQLEKGDRNFSYERAIVFRDYLGMVFDLPKPDFTNAEPITRNRKRSGVKDDPFFIEIDGDLIEVLTYRRHGKIKTATKVYES